MENIYFSNILVCQVLRRMRWFSYSPSSSWMKHSWGFEFECLVQGLVKNVGSRTNYVVIFSFSFLIWKWKHYICMKVKVAQSCLTLCDPMVPLSLEFSRPEYWSGSLLQGIFPTQGLSLRSPALQVVSLPSGPPGKPKNTGVGSLFHLQRIFLTQESNQDLLHCRQIPFQLNNRSIRRIHGKYFTWVVYHCFCCVTKSCPILLWPYRLLSNRLLCPWDFPHKNTAVGSYFLL